MENKITEEKPVYFTPSDVVMLSSKRFPAKSLVTSSRPPGLPFVLYDPAKHGVGYKAGDLDERRRLSTNERGSTMRFFPPPDLHNQFSLGISQRHNLSCFLPAWIISTLFWSALCLLLPDEHHHVFRNP